MFLFVLSSISEDICRGFSYGTASYMKLPSVSQYAKISFSEIKVPGMFLRKLFNSRLGSICHLGALLFKHVL